ncbi:cardiolipin synthase [Fundicoccus culcitae]|uniref:Cardiolipin synthase n=1 Tax=Fundicoccus culcitae TaxID=2969821 RepID=A0ABY5P2P0_9LACT|nr:cardiolipin synthase [Fundicoccus culcitae]UUX32976.1 cardiolipin synthase [Fundicoccus culcitae]
MLKKLLNNSTFIRLFIYLILIIIQIAWWYVFFTNIISHSALINAILTLFSVFMILYLVSKDESPAYRISWIIVISLMPIFGGLLYAAMGNKRPQKSMTRLLNNQSKLHMHEMETVPSAKKLLFQKDQRLGSMSQYIHDYGDSPVYTNTGVTYFPAGETMMDTLLKDLEEAKEHIFIEFFIIEDGLMMSQIFDVLKKKAKEGVDVRLIYDDFGCLLRLPSDFDKQMEAEGIKTLKFNPVMPILSLVYNTRDHRKMILIDREIGYTGGLNIADEYINHVERFGYWKDNMIRMDGPATWNLTVLFLNMWNAFYPTDDSYVPFKPIEKMDETFDLMANDENISATGFVQSFGDSPLDDEVLGENVYRDMLNAAKDYVYIYTPYLVVSYELQTAMTLAAKRGVDVRLMTPGIPDKPIVYRMTRSHYRPLLEGGVKIYEYTPGFLHAKTFIVDDKIVNIGTINLDYRSLYLHFETGTMLYYHPVIKDIKADFLESQSVSKQIQLTDIKTTSIGALWDAILRLVAPFV